MSKRGRPTTHGARKLLATLQGKDIDPATLKALRAYVTEIAEDDGGIHRQSRRRQRLTRRTAMLEMVADTLDAYILQHGAIDAAGEPLSCFKLYGWVTNSLRRHYETLGLDSRPDRVPSLSEYLQARTVAPAPHANGNGQPDAATPVTAPAGEAAAQREEQP